MIHIFWCYIKRKLHFKFIEIYKYIQSVFSVMSLSSIKNGIFARKKNRKQIAFYIYCKILCIFFLIYNLCWWLLGFEYSHWNEILPTRIRVIWGGQTCSGFDPEGNESSDIIYFLQPARIHSWSVWEYMMLLGIFYNTSLRQSSLWDRKSVV